jgi:5-methylthioadenosine/S-adenosylhomocysteine deaminase
LMDESGGYDPIAVDLHETLDACDDLLAEWGDDEDVRLGIAPRFALSCTGENMRAAADYAREHGLLLHTHASEQLEEVQLVMERTGLANIAYLHSVGLTGADVGLAHCVHTDEEERAILAETETRVLHCPSANFKLGSGVAPIPEYLERGIVVSIGADGTPCNNRLDGFMEMREAGLMQKPRLGADVLPAASVVDMATRGGARALGWESEMGTLEIGKRANLILLDPDSFHVIPSTDDAANVVYAHAASDVVMTMVNGRILYEDGALTCLDEDALRATVREQRGLLMERAGLA